MSLVISGLKLNVAHEKCYNHHLRGIWTCTDMLQAAAFGLQSTLLHALHALT